MRDAIVVGISVFAILLGVSMGILFNQRALDKLETRLDGRLGKLDGRIDRLQSELTARIDRIQADLRSSIESWATTGHE